jgi:amidophosphoribosyltransferase
VSPVEVWNDQPRESCGIFGVYGIENCAPLIYAGMFALQHRGQEGAGMVVSDRQEVRSYKGQGLVSDVFEPAAISRLPGSLGIGHVRYSTTGASRIQNVQPLVVECVDGIWAVAHNGNLVNASALRQMYQESGAIFQTSTDSEVLVHLLADPLYRSRPRRVARALAELEGAFSFLLMTKDCVMAARDPHGFRPLSIGRLGDGYVFASETCALGQVGAEYVRDVCPGELVVADASGLHSSYFADSGEKTVSSCIFEMIYFARPDSQVFGRNVHGVRVQYGMRLAEEYPVEADVVIPVPDSGVSASLGYSRRSGIPLDFGYIRNHYIGRTFIMPESAQRSGSVDLKLSVVQAVVRGRRVVVVDDSIVRGTTTRQIVSLLRRAGAREIHVRISAPPIHHPCFYGIDTSIDTELIASRMDVDAIRRFVGADSLAYLSIEGVLSAIDLPRDRFCFACFDGRYPVPVPYDVASHKFVLEDAVVPAG